MPPSLSFSLSLSATTSTDRCTPCNPGNTSRLIAILREIHLADYRERQHGAAPILSPFIDPSPSLKIVPCPQFHLVVILFFTVFAGPPPAEYGSSESQVEIFYSRVVVYWRNVYRKMAVCPVQFGRLNPYLQEVMLIRNDSTAKAGANYCQTARQATHSQRQLTFCSQSKEKGATAHTVTPWFFWWAM